MKTPHVVKRGDTYHWRRMLDGKIHTKSLNTTDARTAAELAKQADRALEMAAGLGQVEKFEESIGVRRAKAVSVPAIGEILARYAADRLLPVALRTRRNNILALRMMVRVATGRDEVDALPCSVLDDKLVRDYQNRRLRAVGEDKLQRDRVAVSVNSTHAQARSVFSKRSARVKLYEGMTLPPCLRAFVDAQPLEVLRRDNYQVPESGELGRVFGAADALRQAEPEVWAAFWLASMTGMRRGECIHARWRWLADTAVRVQFEADFVPKGKRERFVPVVPDVRAELVKLATDLGWPMAPEDTVLPGSLTARFKMFKRLGKWMGEQGWTRRKKAHELRAVFASALTASADAYTAQHALGHQEIETTMRYAARPEVKAVDPRAMVASQSPSPNDERSARMAAAAEERWGKRAKADASANPPALKIVGE